MGGRDKPEYKNADKIELDSEVQNKGIWTSWKILDHGYFDVWYKFYL